MTDIFSQKFYKECHYASCHNKKSPIHSAFEDIQLGIHSDIVHKYLLSNAPDMIAIAEFSVLCNQYDPNLFGWAVCVAHAMINPRIIGELSDLIRQFNGDKQKILDEIHKPEIRARWNTEAFHQEMKAVSSSYTQHGGFELSDFNKGIAAEILDENFKDKLNALARIVNDWLNASTSVAEEDLIQSIFKLQIPGMKDDLNNYWLLHFCRWVSFVRSTVLDLPIIESERYFSMIGVELFRKHYDGLTTTDMPVLFEMTKAYIAQHELKHGRVVTKFTYGDFGCLACETHRMFDQLSKDLKCDDDGARCILYSKLDTNVADWIAYKNTHQGDVGPSVRDSARHNTAIFAKRYQAEIAEQAAEKEQVSMKMHRAGV